MLRYIIYTTLLSSFSLLTLGASPLSGTWREHEAPQLLEWTVTSTHFSNTRKLILPQELQFQGTNYHAIKHSPDGRFLVVTDAYLNDRFHTGLEGNRAIIDREKWNALLLGDKAPFYYGPGGSSIDFSINAELFDPEAAYHLSEAGFLHNNHFISYKGELKPIAKDKQRPRKKSDTASHHVRPDSEYYGFCAVDRATQSQLYWSRPQWPRESEHYQMKLVRWGESEAQSIALPHLENHALIPSQLQIHDSYIYVTGNTNITIENIEGKTHQSIPWQASSSDVNEGVVYTACTVFPSGNVAAVRQVEDRSGQDVLTDIIILKKGKILHQIQHRLSNTSSFKLMDYANRLRPQRVANYLCIVDEIQSERGKIAYRFYDCSDGHLGKSKTIQTERFCSFYHTIFNDVLIGILESSIRANQ